MIVRDVVACLVFCMVPLAGPAEQDPPNIAPPVPHVLRAGERAAALQALRSAAVPLASVDPSAARGDLAAFERGVGDARIVGLGEATHGTSEFFALKDRLFRDLVEKKGFTVFAFEGNEPEAREMDRYVTTGQGDPARALAAMYFWTWQTTEVRDLAVWMRAYNAAPGKHPTLHLAGFDMQTPDVAMASVTAFAKAHDPAAGAAIEAAYGCLPAGYWKRQAMTPETSSRCAASIRSVVPLLAKLNPEAETAHDARIVEQYAEWDLSGTRHDSAVRDRAMAENVGWLAETKYPAAKIALWAHNFHVSDMVDDGARTMGSYLQERFGAGYYRLGFAFDRGTVRALLLKQGDLREQEVPPALPASLEGLLREAGELYFVDLDRLPPSPLRDWLGGETLQREIGSAFDPAYDAEFYSPRNVRVRFDGLIFVEQNHAAHGLEALAGN